MTPRDFVYWLQGYFELTPGEQGLSPEQVKVIKDHLQLVMTKVTPDITIPYSPSSYIPSIFNKGEDYKYEVTCDMGDKVSRSLQNDSLRRSMELETTPEYFCSAPPASC